MTPLTVRPKDFFFQELRAGQISRTSFGNLCLLALAQAKGALSWVELSLPGGTSSWTVCALFVTFSLALALAWDIFSTLELLDTTQYLEAILPRGEPWSQLPPREFALCPSKFVDVLAVNVFSKSIIPVRLVFKLTILVLTSPTSLFTHVSLSVRSALSFWTSPAFPREMGGVECSSCRVGDLPSRASLYRQTRHSKIKLKSTKTSQSTKNASKKCNEVLDNCTKYAFESLSFFFASF